MKNRESVVNSHSVGIFKASNWKKEGDGLLVAAKALRQQWLSSREEVIKVVTDRSPRSSEVFTKDSALARSSMLLLAIQWRCSWKMVLLNSILTVLKKWLSA